MSYYQNSISSGFIDLATYSTTDHYMFGDNAKKDHPDLYQGDWTTNVPCELSKVSEESNKQSFRLSQERVYVDRLWLEIRVKTKDCKVPYLAHNIFEEITITMNDLVIWRVDNYVLDFLMYVNMPSSKLSAYQKYTNVDKDGFCILCLPLPLRNSIPMFMLFNTEGQLNLTLRQFDGVEIVRIQPWASYRIIPDQTQKTLLTKPLKIPIETYQTFQYRSVPEHNTTPNYDLRFSGSIRAWMVGAKKIDTFSTYERDFITSISLAYEETARLNNLPPYYYEFVQPFYHSNAVNLEGIYLYSYSNGLLDDQKGAGTNYSRLTNTSLFLRLKPDTNIYRIVVVGIERKILCISDGSCSFLSEESTLQIE